MLEAVKNRIHEDKNSSPYFVAQVTHFFGLRLERLDVPRD